MKTSIIRILLIIAVFNYSCKTASSPKLAKETGMASFYNNKHEGNKTASGEVYRKGKLTAAHKTLPFGTQVKVTNLANSRTVVVRVNDRGPFVRGRIIDLSRRAAQKLGMINDGVTKVRIEYTKTK
jgi:rare lipoprotein A